MSTPEKQGRLYGLFYFIIFEIAVYNGLKLLLAGMGQPDQLQPENTVVPNWVKAVTFILLYILCLLVAVMVISNVVPAKYRKQQMQWVYLALAGMVIMLFLLFN